MRMRQRHEFCPGDNPFWPGVSGTVQAPDTLDQVIKSLAGLTRVDRKCDQSVCDCFRNWELAFAKAAFLKRRRVMQWRVMRPHFDSFLEEHRVNEIVAIAPELPGINLHRVKMEDMFAAR